MATALAGALSCGRCGHPDGADPDGGAGVPRCPRCGLRRVPAAPGSAVGAEVGPLGGVVRATVGRRSVAHLIDLLPVLALVGATVVLGVPALVPDHVAPRPLLVAVPVGVLVGLASVQLLLLTRAGRSVGRLALGLRTVDDLTGTPVGFRRWGRLIRPGSRRRLVTAAVRQGRDPLDPRLAAVASELAAPLDPADAPDRAARHRGDPTLPVAGADERRPSVAIVLGNGERYEIWHALLLGRSPVDPDGGRALLAWPDLSRRLAKTHVLLEWSGTTLWITDLATAGGTALVSPAGDRTPLVPGVRTATAVGWTVECGGRTFTVRPGTAGVPPAAARSDAALVAAAPGGAS